VGQKVGAKSIFVQKWRFFGVGRAAGQRNLPGCDDAACMAPTRQACAAVLVLSAISSANLYFLLAGTAGRTNNSAMLAGAAAAQRAPAPWQQPEAVASTAPPRHVAETPAPSHVAETPAPSVAGGTSPSRAPTATPASRYMLRPATHATCIEVEDLRAVADRCDGASVAAPLPTPRPPRVVCPHSLEDDCVRRRASPAASCVLRRAPLVPATLGWPNVVFAAAVFDDATSAALMQVAADTWLQMTRGAELFLATDADDPRTDEEVAPQTHGAVRVRVHRCADCRGRRCVGTKRKRGTVCTGKREGWLARRKVLSMFRALGELYLGAPAPLASAAARAARFFVKVQTPTCVYIHVYIHTHIYISIYIERERYIHAYTYVCIYHVYIYIYI